MDIMLFPYTRQLVCGNIPIQVCAPFSRNTYNLA